MAQSCPLNPPPPSDRQHALTHSEVLRCIHWPLVRSAAQHRRRSGVFCAAAGSHTKACPALLHIIAGRAAMTRFSGSTALSSSTHTHGDPQALHHGRATPRTSGVQAAQGRPGSHSAEPPAELAGLKDELGEYEAVCSGPLPPKRVAS